MGPRCGVVAGARSPCGAGQRSAGGPLALRTMQFPKVSRPQRVLFVFWRGWFAEDGPQPRGKSPSLEKGGAGGSGTGHHLSTEPDFATPETWRWIPGGPLPNPIPPSSLRSPPCAASSCSLRVRSLPQRLDFGHLRSA